MTYRERLIDEEIIDWVIDTRRVISSVHTRSKRASGGCLWLLVAMKDVASDETLRGPAGRG